MKAIYPFIASLLLSALCISGSVAPALAAEHTGERPLLVVRFNQEHVYYARALNQAVANAERVKPTVRYSVVSYMPDGKRKGQGNVSVQQAKANLDAVTGQMQKLGVDSSRLQARTEKASVMSQEIKIYVE